MTGGGHDAGASEGRRASGGNPCRRQRVGVAAAACREADQRILAPSIQPGRPPQTDAGYARRIRSQTRLTQAEFAARIGVPIETVRNWEQGKRQPRGPARALLRLLDEAPDVAFSVLSRKLT